MKFFAAIFFAFLLVIIILADAGHLGFLGVVYSFPHGDKLGHFLLFGMAAFLIFLTVSGLHRFSDSRRAAVIATLFLACLVGLEEWSQKFFPGRSSSWMDLTFSYMGMALGAWSAWKLNGKRV